MSVKLVQDYSRFVSEKFEYEAEVNSAYNLKKSIRVRQGQAFLLVTTEAREAALYTIKVHVDDSKEPEHRLLPGNRGTIDYEVLDDSHVQLSFTAAYC